MKQGIYNSEDVKIDYRGRKQLLRIVSINFMPGICGFKVIPQETTQVGQVRRMQTSTRKALTSSLHLLIPITVRGRAMGGVEAEPDRGLGAAIQDFPSVTTSPTPSLLSINGSLDEVGSSGDSTPHCFSPPKFSVRLPPIRTPPPITRQVTGKKFFSLLSSDPTSLACDMLFSVLSLSLSVPNGEIITWLSFPDIVGLSKQLRTVGGTEKMLVSCMLYSDTHQYNH